MSRINLKDNSHRWTLVFAILAVSVVAWMIWSWHHEPNCLALYGEATRPKIADSIKDALNSADRVDKFLDCSDENMANMFLVQAEAIGCLFGAMLLAWGLTTVWEWAEWLLALRRCRVGGGRIWRNVVNAEWRKLTKKLAGEKP